MKNSEFDEWFQHHARCVGGFSEWLAKGRDQTEQARVMSMWRQALHDVSFDDAKAASMAIMRGEIESRGFGDHPKEICRYAKSRRGERAKRERRFINGQEVFACRKCSEDSGVRVCYHPRAVNEVIRNRLECVIEVQRSTGKPEHTRKVMPKMATCCYACDCDAGREWQDRGMPAYDELRCVLAATVGGEAMIAELFAGVDERVAMSVKSRPNYERGFDQFNQSGYVNEEIGF